MERTSMILNDVTTRTASVLLILLLLVHNGVAGAAFFQSTTASRYVTLEKFCPRNIRRQCRSRSTKTRCHFSISSNTHLDGVPKRREGTVMNESHSKDEDEEPKSIDTIWTGGRLAKAAAKAAKAANARAAAARRKPSSAFPGKKRATKNNSSWHSRSSKEEEEEVPPTLSQLVKLIDAKLYAKTRSSPPARFLDAPAMAADDECLHVAIVFGKTLIRDQITVEYASRIQTLAKLLKAKEQEFHLVCFCGGNGNNNHVADADAGYVYFRHLCESQSIPLDDGIEFFIDNVSLDEEDMVRAALREVQEVHVPQWLTKETDATNNKVHIHFTLISTEYHVRNMNNIHHRSPRQSLLKGIERLRGSFTSSSCARTTGSHTNNRDENLGFLRANGNDDVHITRSGSIHSRHGDDDGDDDETSEADSFDWSSGVNDEYTTTRHNKNRRMVVKGIVDTSWSFQYSSYVYSDDEAAAFLGKCYLLGEELIPLLVNLKGVVEQKEFFQRDNYLLLASIRHSLVSHVEGLHNPHSSRKFGLKLHSRNMYLQQGGDPRSEDWDVIVVLEGAVLSLGRCVDLVRPAGLLVSSVPRADWAKALRALEHGMSDIRSVCDPDRPLRPAEWGKLEATTTASEETNTNDAVTIEPDRDAFENKTIDRIFPQLVTDTGHLDLITGLVEHGKNDSDNEKAISLIRPQFDTLNRWGSTQLEEI